MVAIAFTTLFVIINKVSYVYIGLVNLDSIPDIGKYFLTHAGKLLLQTLILIYLFQKDVNIYFDFSNQNKSKKFGIIFILNLILYAIFFYKGS